MNQTDQPKYKNIEGIFDTKYYIDFYQRNYTWSIENVETLIDDIFHRFDIQYISDGETNSKYVIDNYRWYYLNTFIINEQNGKICLVDGQQRFSTISLILIWLHHLAKNRELSDSRIDTLKQLICKSTSEGYDFWMGGNDRNKAFEELFKYGEKRDLNRTVNYSEHNLYDRYHVVKNRINEKLALYADDNHYLDTFILYFLKNVKLIQINIQDSDDVAMVFEVINAKGQKLKSHEILKAQLLSKIDKTELDKFLELWESICHLLRLANLKYKGIEDPIDSFFTFYFKSRYTKNISEIKNFKDYHRTILSRGWQERFPVKTDSNFVKSFIEKELYQYAINILKIIELNNNYKDDYKFIYFNGTNVNDINSNQISILLSSITLEDDDVSFSQKIKIISKLLDKHFSVLKLQGSYESNSFNVSCNNLILKLRNIENEEEIKTIFEDEIINEIKNQKDTDSITSLFNYAYFKDFKMTNNKSFIRYTLARVESFLVDEIGLNPVNFKQLISGRTYNIEHILSRNEENLSLFHNNIDNFNEQRQKIGGLLLLIGGDNNLSMDELYRNKLRTYENGTVWAKTLTRNFYHNNSRLNAFFSSHPNIVFRNIDVFDENTLELRQKILFEIIKEIWN
jgi:uncharacterized protein with ParB-like and HNH nuclease domain